jgi:hypothetical protein
MENRFQSQKKTENRERKKILYEINIKPQTCTEL